MDNSGISSDESVFAPQRNQQYMGESVFAPQGYQQYSKPLAYPQQNQVVVPLDEPLVLLVGNEQDVLLDGNYQNVLTIFKSKLGELSNEFQCSMCIETFKDPHQIQLPGCYHIHCKNCIDEPMNDHKCPLCRTIFSDTDLVPMREIQSIIVKTKEVLKTIP
jgi:hypothetical protein